MPKRAFIYILALFILFAFALWKKIHSGELPFKNPANQAQKIANFVAIRGEAIKFNEGTETEGMSHTYFLYSGSDFFELTFVRWPGNKVFYVSYYGTNFPFEEIKTPASAAAREIKFGRPKTYIEEQFVDLEVDMIVDSFHQFTKKQDGLYMGFTREERDLGKETGVKQYSFAGKSELAENGWQDASENTLKEMNEAYNETLSIISKKLRIK